jgi:hypothetical protein
VKGSEEDPDVSLTLADVAIVVAGLSPACDFWEINQIVLHCVMHFEFNHTGMPRENQRLFVYDSSNLASLEFSSEVRDSVFLLIYLLKMVHVHNHTF